MPTQQKGIPDLRKGVTEEVFLTLILDPPSYSMRTAYLLSHYHEISFNSCITRKGTKPGEAEYEINSGFASCYESSICPNMTAFKSMLSILLFPSLINMTLRDMISAHVTVNSYTVC